MTPITLRLYMGVRQLLRIYSLQNWLHRFAPSAPTITAVATVVMAVAAIYTAFVVKQTADVAVNEFTLARRPAVFLTDLEPKLASEMSGSGTDLILVGVFREVRGIPTNVHSVRAGYYYRWEPSTEARWRTIWRDFLLYGDHLTRPMILGSVDTEHLEAHKSASRRFGKSLNYVIFLIEYTFSVQGGRRTKWSVGVYVSCDEDGNFSVSQPAMPDIEPVQED